MGAANKILIALASILSCGMLHAQQNHFVFRHFDQHDGLAHNHVFDIIQDKHGFIWLITPNGLQRFDGSRFVNYNERLNTSFFLNNDSKLYVDKDDNIWIPRINELRKLEINQNTFKVCKPPQANLNNQLQLDTFRDGSNNIILLGKQFSLIYDSVSKSNKWATLNLHPLTPNETNYFAADRANGNVWTVSVNGLGLFDRETKTIYSADYNPTSNLALDAFRVVKEGDARLVMADRDNNIWIITWGGLFYKYDAAKNKLITFSLGDIELSQKKGNHINSPASVNCLYQDNHGTIWASTDYDGLLVYDPDKNSFSPVSLEQNNQHQSLFNYQVYCIFQDKDENIWLGTDNGITIFNPYRQYFQSVHHDELNESIANSEIQSFIQTVDGDNLVGTWGSGIAVYDSTWHYKRNLKIPEPAYEGNLVWYFVQNDDGNIWAGCQHGFIHIINPVTGTLKTIHPPELQNSTVRSMTKDQEGNIWIGLHNGNIAEWNKSDGKFTSTPVSEQSNGITPAVKFLLIDNRKNVWGGTETGLKLFDATSKKCVAVFLPDSSNRSSITSKNIETMVQLNDSVLILGTSLGGLNFLNLNTKRFSSLTTQNGFPANTIHSIKLDGFGNIWFTSDYNLYKYNLTDKKYTLYNIEPGIINEAFSSPLLYSLKNGDWVTCTPTEVIHFNPKDLSNQSNQPGLVQIAGLRVMDKPVFIDSFIMKNNPIVLNYKDNFINIEFSALDFASILQTKYYYKLSGVNQNWVNAGSRKVATYTNLDPGNYVFAVKAEYGNNQSKETTLNIIIEPPFWKTSWFYVLSVIFIIAIVYFLFQRRIRFIRAKAELKQKVAETEMIALRAQMNPHFIFNCLNSIDNLIQTNEKDKATAYLARFAKLIRAILENSKNDTVPCWKDLETLKIYLQLEELRWGKNVTYKLNIDPEILLGDYKVPPMIIQPYVENAIHHGLLNKESGERNLLIEVKAQQNLIIYTIEDTGIGRKKALEYKLLNKPNHHSMGLDITKERIKLFNNNSNPSVTISDLYNDEKEIAGTRVIVSLLN